MEAFSFHFTVSGKKQTGILLSDFVVQSKEMERKRSRTDGKDVIDYHQSTQSVKVLEKLDTFRELKEGCDFVSKVESKEFSVHKNILMANSEYFRAMFRHDTLENGTGCVQLQHIDEECIGACVDFMYCLPISISNGKIEELLNVSDMLQLLDLRGAIAKYYQRRLNDSTFYGTLQLAYAHKLAALEKYCNEYAAENFQGIIQLGEYKFMSKEYLPDLLESVENETCGMNKAKAILNWVRFDIESRKALIPELLGKIILSEIPVRFRRYLVNEEPLTSTSFECVKMLCSSFMSTLSRYDIAVCCQREPAANAVTVEANSIAFYDHGIKCLQYFKPEEKTWKQGYEIPQGIMSKKFSFSPFCIDGYIYALMENKAVYRLKYADKNPAWTKMAVMLENHGELPHAFGDSNNLFVAGYWQGRNPYGRCIERYNHLYNSNTWTKVSDVTVAVGCTCVYLDQAIYCLGDSNIGSRGVNVYDTISKEWLTAAPMLKERHFASAAKYNSMIYVLGGMVYNKIVSSMECYDPITNMWTIVSPILEIKGPLLNVFLLENEIFVIGGSSQKIFDVAKFNLKNKNWEKVGFNAPPYTAKIMLQRSCAIHIAPPQKQRSAENREPPTVILFFGLDCSFVQMFHLHCVEVVGLVC